MFHEQANRRHIEETRRFVHETLKDSANGDARAQYNLGVMYETGNGVEQDSAKAVELYRHSL